jgi:hypothetical protein
MLVDVRPTTRLRGPEPIDVTAALGPIVHALGQDSVDLSRVRLVCDWIQYRNNFRDVVDARPILARAPGNDLDSGGCGGSGLPPHGNGLELAVDLRRCGEADTGALTRAVLGNGDAAAPGRAYLEPWRPGSASCIWDFNRLYWQALSPWEEAAGRRYEQALPGGSSDARNVAGVRELIMQLFEVWDELAARNALPDELYVVELGVGNGNQARVFLDELRRLDRAHGSDHYRRLHYLMGDYSPHVLEQARAAVAHHGEHVSSMVLDATQPTTALGFLRYKVFLVYVSNVYDNLPTDEVARIGGRVYRVDVRAYLPADAAGRIARQASAAPEAVGDLVAKLLRLGPELLAEALPRHFPDCAAAVRFWRECWQALRLEERYVPLEGLDLYEIAPKVTGEALRPVLEAGGDIRMHASNGAVASFVDTLPLLHPYGRVHCHDLFVTDPHRYETGFCGPGKYDGSVVNWVNGPLLQWIGARRGFDVRYTPFAHRQGTNITTLTARVRD